MNILLIYHYPLGGDASTIVEHFTSFEKYSQNNILKVNVAFNCPKNLKKIKFDCIILHYSLFGSKNYVLNDMFLDFLEKSKSHKVAFFQDEYHFCQQRFDFINRYKINTIYTLLHPEYFDETYYKYTNAKKVYTTLTGYVDNNLLQNTKKFFIPYENRNLDISYRARELPYYMGKEAQEKVDIAKEVKKRLKDSELNIDVKFSDNSRLYGNQWYKMIANSKAVLGVESGVSIFDLDGKAYEAYTNAMNVNPNISKEDIFKVLEHWEGQIYYRAISPRIFEAASFKVCQILFEGDYQGMLKPMIHYIPLKKDFSNFDDVLEILKDDNKVNKIIEQAYTDLIASKHYTYQEFVNNFDNNLSKDIYNEDKNDISIKEINSLLDEDSVRRKLRAYIKYVLTFPFYGRKQLVKIVKYLLGDKISANILKLLFGNKDNIKGKL